MAKKKRKEKRFSLLYIIGGGILKEDFIVKHTRFIILFVMLTIFFIGNRYSCVLKQKQINRLQIQLKETEMEALSISVDLAKYSQHSLIEQRVRQQGLGLENPRKPSYILSK